MNVARPKPMTLAEFLVWEERQPLRYEFDGVAPRAMTGGTAGHARVQANLAGVFTRRLRGSRCGFFGSVLKFLTAGGQVRYPDGMVVCSPFAPRAKWVEDPTVVFEVLSPSTTRTDRIAKAREYQATPSIARYVMLEQDSMAAVVYARSPDGWLHAIVLADGVLEFPEIGVAFPLAELYEGIDVEPLEEEPDSA